LAFSYTAALQGRIALAVWGVSNSSLNATQKVQLDGTWTTGALSAGVAYDAYIEMSQLAQYFEQAAATPDLSFPEPAWDRLFVAKAAMILVKTVRPDRLSEFQRDHEVALDEAIDTYARDLISSTSLAGQDIKLAGIRSFVIDHCVKRADANTGLRRRLFPNISQIDGHIQWVLNFLWNVRPWHFRKRQVLVRLITVDISTATWTQSTKTLTSTGSFTDTRIAIGGRVLITGGTDVLTGEYVIVSRTSDNAIVLDTSIASTAANLTAGDITGSVAMLVMEGMHGVETFDAVASRRLYYEGLGYGAKIEWKDSNDMAMAKAVNSLSTGLPRWFRWEKYSTGVTWHLSPFPDGNYTLRGAVSVSGPGTLTDNTSLDTAIARFPTDFGTVIRDMVLARVLLFFRASDGEGMWRRAIDQCDNLLPSYSDQGFATRQTSMEDVYGDHGSIVGTHGEAYGY
jgi:hypothetical protein